MAFSRLFAIGLLWRLALALLAASGLAGLVARGGYIAPVAVMAACLALALRALWRYLTHTNRELARFVEAVTHGDLTQRFGQTPEGVGFEDLAAALDRAMGKLRRERAEAGDEGRLSNALVESAPVALLMVDGAGKIELANAAARRSFGGAGAVNAADYARPFGAEFAAALTSIRSGDRRTLALTLDGAPARALLTAARLVRPSGELMVISVQPIGGELGAAELAAETDLIRVLTHEIMNSITPVTSLARTAADLLQSLPAGPPGIAEAREAVAILARRADGLMRFLESYRQISRTPQVRRQSFPADAFVSELLRLLRADWPSKRLTISSDVAAGLKLDADPDLLAQVVINLLRNAAEAAAAGRQGRVWLRVARAANGRAEFIVDDDGPGLPEALRHEAFLPFFTTKPTGTGVGLSLARQVVLAHGGAIAAEANSWGGARLRFVI